MAKTLAEMKAAMQKELEEEEKRIAREEGKRFSSSQTAPSQNKAAQAKANKEADLIGAKDAAKLNPVVEKVPAKSSAADKAKNSSVTKNKTASEAKQTVYESVSKKAGAQSGLDKIEAAKTEKAAAQAKANKEKDLLGFDGRAYQQQLAQQKEEEKVEYLNVKEARDRKYVLEQELEKAKAQAKEETAKAGTVQIVASGRKGANNSFVSPETQKRIDELEKEISDLNKNINLASRKQEGKYLYNSAVNAEDFDEYSKEIEKEKQQKSAVPFKQANQERETETVKAFMTEEQKAVYNYYLNKFGEEKAEEYFDSIREELNKKQAQAMFAGNEGKVLNEYIQGAAAGLENSKEGYQSFLNMILGIENPQPTSTMDFVSQMAREDLANAGFKLPEALGGASLGQIGFDAINTTANMLPSLMLGTLGGAGIGAVAIGASAAGNAYNSAITEGYSKEQATNYAALVGASEAALGYLLGGIEATGGKIGKAAMAKVLPKIDNALAKAAVNVGGKMLSEFSEEYLQEVLSPVFENIALMEENEIDLLSPEAIYSGILGALSAGGIALVDGSLNVPEAIQKTEVPVPFEGKAQPGTEAAIIADKITEIENRPISEAEKAAKMEEVMEAVLETTGTAEVVAEAEKIKNYHNERQAEFDEAVEIGKKLGISVELDPNIAGNGIHTSDGRIIINPNTENPALQVFVHELTHDIETSGLYESFSKKILEHASQIGLDVNKIRAMVIEDYKAAGHNLTDRQADAEIVAKYCEQHLFTDQKAIDRLLSEDRSLFQKIKDWISDMIVKFKGAPEERFLLEAERLYEKALATRGEVSGIDSESVGRSFDEMAGEAKAEHGVSKGISAEIFDSAKRVIEQMRPQKPKAQSSTSQVNPETESTNLVDVPQSKKSERIEKRYQKAVEDGVASVFGIDRRDIKNDIRPLLNEIAADVKDGKTITDEQIDALYKTAFDNGYITEEFPRYDETRKYIREHPIYVSQENRNEFGEDKEFYNFMRSNYGSIKVTTDPGAIHLDEFYDIVSNKAQDWFDSEETDPKTQLESIADFMQQTKKQYKGLSELYFGSELADFEAWAKDQLKAYMEDFGKGLDTVARYERDRQIKAEHKAKEMNPEASFEQAKAAFAGNKVFNLQKELEKVKAKYVLSENDVWTVKRLLEGTLKEEDVRAAEGSNVEGILDVYNAEKAYKEARAPFDRYAIAVKQSINHDAINALERSDEFKDKKGKLGGAALSIETAERNVRDIAGDEADKIIENYFNNVHEDEAMSNRFMTEMNQRVKDLEIGKMNRWERAYAQMIGENAKYIAMGKITKHNQAEHDLLNLKIQDLLNRHGHKIDKEKCEKAAAGFMGIYQDIFEKINDERIRVGLEPIGYIENYFPHFVEAKPETVFQKFFSKVLGMDVGDSKLPTDIAGKTADRKPGKKWNPHTLERKGDVTDYDILKGFDGYLRLAAHNIYHTEDIKKLRALSETIRTKYASTDLEKRIEELMNNKALSEVDRSELIQKAISEVPDIYHLSNFVVWLDEYTNILAGKKSYGDRDAEYLLGREMYDVSKAIEGRIASNMVGYNLTTPFMNIIPLFQATADIPPQNIISSVVQTGVAALKKDSFISDNSDFITNRLGTDTLYKQNYNIFEAENMKDFVAKVSDGGGFLMGYADRIVSESLVRARYEQNLKNGMDKVSAFSEADQWAAGLIADRSLGAMPTIMNRKNPIIKAFTMFQLEQANQYSYIFKDAGKYKWKKKGAMSTISGQIAFWLAMALAGDLAKELLNKEDAVPNPVGITKDVVEKVQKGEKVGNIVLDTATNIVKQIPYVGGVLGGGRVPISTALPDLEQSIKLFNKEVAPEKKGQILFDEILKPLSYIFLPSGAGQIWKTSKGVKQLIEGGAFGTEADGSRYMKFPQEYDPESVIKTVLFGQYASDRGQEYIDSNFRSLSAKDTANMELANEYGVSNKDFFDTILGLKEFDKKEEKQEALLQNENLDAREKSVIDWILFGDGKGFPEATRNYTSEQAFWESGLETGELRLHEDGYNREEIRLIEWAFEKGKGKKVDTVENIQKAMDCTEAEAYEIYQRREGKWIDDPGKLPAEEQARAKGAAELYGMSEENFLKVLNYSNFGVVKDGEYSDKKEDVIKQLAKSNSWSIEKAEELYNRVNLYEYSREDLEDAKVKELQTSQEWYGVDDKGYFVARNVIKTAEGTTDKYGNTVSGSVKEAAVKAISEELGVDETEATVYYLAAKGELVLSRTDLTTSQREDLNAAKEEGWTERQYLDAVNLLKVSGATKKDDIIKTLMDGGATYEMAQGYYNLRQNKDYDRVVSTGSKSFSYGMKNEKQVAKGDYFLANYNSDGSVTEKDIAKWYAAAEGCNKKQEYLDAYQSAGATYSQALQFYNLMRGYDQSFNNYYKQKG